MTVLPNPADISDAMAGDMAELEGAGSIDVIAATCPAMDLEFGFFFDGTGNNAGNAADGNTMRANGEIHEEGSYNNDISNVVRLREVFTREPVKNDCGGTAIERIRIYIEGIGTITGGDDSTVGFALGMGETGVYRRVQEAFLTFLRNLNEQKAAAEIGEIRIDVFGFSRGSAAARHFVNCINRGNAGHGYGGPFYEVQPEDKPKIKVRFVGLFDCVVSTGLVADDDNFPGLMIGFNEGSAEKAVNLFAQDEFRMNFSAALLEDGGGEDIRLPGAHSDIGGGYPAHWSENVLIQKTEYGDGYRKFSSLSESSLQRLTALTPEDRAEQARLIEEGWILPSEASAYQKKVLPFGNGGYKIETRLVRPWVKHTLSRVALHIMHKKAYDAGVPFPASLPNREDYALPADLVAIEEKLYAGQTLSLDEIKFLRRNYTHYSSHWASMSGFFAMQPQPGNNRMEYPNVSSEAQ